MNLPRIPRMHFVEARWLRAGDLVWRDDFAFDCILGIAPEGDGVRVSYTDGRFEHLDARDLRKVPVSVAEAEGWSAQRGQFTPDLLQALGDAYGSV